MNRNRHACTTRGGEGNLTFAFDERPLAKVRIEMLP